MRYTCEADFGAMRTLPRRTVAVLRLTACAAAIFALPACNFGMPPGGTQQGHDINSLYRLLFWFAIPIGVIVYGLILWSVIRYRKRKDDDGTLPKQRRYNLPLEIVYTAVPVVIVLVLFGFTLTTMNRVDAVSKDPAVTVDVTGFRWQWSFEYPGHGFSVIGVGGTTTRGPTMVLPVGQTVHVDLHATDVIHSFFVPDFNFKRDAIPGVTNTFDLTIPRPGVFRGECAELCGVDHADMTFYVRAVPVAEFQAWLQQHEGDGVIQEGGP
jgi:cytochrome c oxidase subunit 2